MKYCTAQAQALPKHCTCESYFFATFLLEGGRGGGSTKNGHGFPFLDNIELYKCSLKEFFEKVYESYTLKIFK